MLDDYHSRRQELAGNREEEYRDRLSKARRLLEAEKEARRNRILAERAAEIAAQEAAQEEELAKEEEQRGLYLISQLCLTSIPNEHPIHRTSSTGRTAPPGSRS
jgi:hypothetical protein